MTISDLCIRVYGPIKEAHAHEAQAGHGGTATVKVVVSPPDWRALLVEFRQFAAFGSAFNVEEHKPTVFGVPLESDYVLGPGEIVLRTEVRL